MVINEFLADPAGPDSGREFVELLNTGPDTVSLAEVAFQFANGAVELTWATRWHGIAGMTLMPGGRLLLADRNWQGEVTADAEVYLGLQNGPDAIRLVRGTTVLDLVGYGSLTDQEMFEGDPVAIATGRSSARRPDGYDTDNNRHDFAGAVPSPGAQNFELYSVALQARVLTPSVLSRPGDDLAVSLSLRNDGTEVLPGGWCSLVGDTTPLTSWWDTTEPDQVRTVVFALRPEIRGPLFLTWEFSAPETSRLLRLELGAVQIGVSELRLTEVMPAPDPLPGEWFELLWTGSGTVELASYQVRDEDGAWRRLPEVNLTTGQRVVLAEDPQGLLAWWRQNTEAGARTCLDPDVLPVVVQLAPWPPLNNSVSGDRSFADRLYLADNTGLVLDLVTWGGDRAVAAQRGVSIERLAPEPVQAGSANWARCVAPVGATPGCINSVGLVSEGDFAGGDLVATPGFLRRSTGDTSLHLRFVLVDEAFSWQLRVFNLWGEVVRDFGGDSRGPGPRDLLWDGLSDQGRSAPAGLYIAWLETRAGSGAVLRRQKIRLVVR